MTFEELQTKYLEEQQKNIQLQKELETTSETLKGKETELSKITEDSRKEIEGLKLHNQKLFLKLTDTVNVFEDKKEEQTEQYDLEKLATDFV